MGFLGDIWNGLVDGLEAILRAYEGVLEPIFGLYAWGIAIILLTVSVRILLIPLMVRQTRSMRAMQQLQPKLKKIQEKYKADRSMMKTDPERYKKLKDKQREAQMALYQEHGVNPVGGCLPLILQAPIFIALFNVLRDGRVEELATAPWIGIDNLTLAASNGAGWGAFVLVVLQVVTMFYSQKQMQARNSATQAAEQQQVQKVMLYVMPAFLGYLSFTFPIGVVLYWVTTNVWTIGQQFFIFRKVEAEEAAAAEERRAQRTSGKSGGTKGGGKSTGGQSTGGKPGDRKPSKGGKPKAQEPKATTDDAGVSGKDDQSAELVDPENPEEGGNGANRGSRKNGTNGATGSTRSGQSAKNRRKGS